MNPDNSRSILIAAFVTIGLGLLLVAPGALPIALIVGLITALSWRDKQNKNAAIPPRSRYDIPSREEFRSRLRMPTTPPPVDEMRPLGAEKVYAHAVKAAENAGMNPDDLMVLPVDLGLMVFKADQDPVVYRNQPVPDDVDYVQPFVQLRLPSRATGEISFEVIDCDGQVLFSRKERHTLERGRNLITPAARLPIHDAHNLRNEWTLRISADGLPIATHHFAWVESDIRRIRQHIGNDGEISNELRATIDNSRLQKLSLDDLLSFQTDEDKKQAGR